MNAGLDVAACKRWWRQRPGREKLMLGACGLGVVLALGDSLGISPVEKRLRAARAAEDQLLARWEQLQSRRKGQQVQDQELRQLEDSLRTRLQAAQARAGLLNQQMTNTTQLPDVLRSVIATMGPTRLLELTFADDASGAAALAAAAPAPIGLNAAGLATAVLTTAGLAPAAAPAANLAPTAAPTAGAPPTARRVYRLPVTLKVSGSWAELSGLLNQVESRAPALQWQTLSLDSNEWPAIQLTLRAHVRSLQPRWGAAP